MAKHPKIVSERIRKAREIEPPHDFILHDWGKPYMGIDVYISERAVEKILRHCSAYSKRRLEAMGYLVGDVCRWKGKEYTLIEDVVTSELDTTSVSVRFSREAFEKLFEELDKIDYDYILVGWYHSHPGHQCFMSMTDINTQKRMFNKSFHVAIVVDPINEEMKAYKLVGNKAEEKVFAIYRENSSSTHKSYELKFEGLEQVSQISHPPKVKKIKRRRVKKKHPEPPKDDPSINILYLLPIFFGIVGGVAGYILASSRDKLGAWKMIVVGLVMGAVWYFMAPFIGS